MLSQLIVSEALEDSSLEVRNLFQIFEFVSFSRPLSLTKYICCYYICPEKALSLLNKKIDIYIFVRRYIFYRFQVNMLLSSFVSKTLCHVIAYVIPLHESISILQDIDLTVDDPRIVTYVIIWSVNAICSVFEILSDLIFAWIPFYYEMKVLFMTWLILPNTFQLFKKIQEANQEGDTKKQSGALQLYKHIIQPYFIQYETQLDEHIERGKQVASDTFSQLASETSTMAMRKSSEFVMQSQAYIIKKAISPKKRSTMGENAVENDTSSNESETTSMAVHAWSKASELWSEFTQVETDSDDEKESESHEEKTQEKQNYSREEILEMRRQARKANDDASSLPVMAEKKDSEKSEKTSSSDHFLAKAFSKAKATLTNGRDKIMAISPPSSPKKSHPPKSQQNLHIEEEEAVQLTAFKMMLVKGIRVQKYGQRSGPKARYVGIDGDATVLRWESTKSGTQARQLGIIHLMTVRVGNLTPGFKRIGTEKGFEIIPSVPDCCLALVTRQKQLLELEVEDKEKRDALVIGFRLLIAWTQERVILKWTRVETLQRHMMFRMALRHWKRRIHENDEMKEDAMDVEESKETEKETSMRRRRK